MLKRKSRVVIDTNLWISFFLTKDFSKLDVLLYEQKVVLLFSNELLEEFLEVTSRPKFKQYFSPENVEHLLQQIHLYSEFIEVTSDVRLCRDEKDNFLLSLAKDGKATHLITGDKDLLELDKIGKTKIVTMADYLI
ncbi:putative toxin-antitoxin system toxin component, PIN family [Flavobacterium cyanobacteriorum]|uniref:Putative toxin-antitoxin system toxin component, PIN family n=1 Tax=Flavobacterium cyanobacteriorum TaxID=2022802 RepID=A0A255YSN9_9FLAO|nr:putative toxin-antitoxin system toxin component, PIN family [Flavobacterium cyanobacteriorum]OYQ32256.1 putative toxin-antitoxin system toxin component, PIN family [Flavobacterium cyanobacteriorum]